MSPVFDLSSLDTTKKANAGVEMQVIHPKTKAPTGMAILLYGMDSDRQQEYQRGYLDRIVGRKAEDPVPDKNEEELEMLAVCTGGWSFQGGPVHLDGQEFPFSKENAKVLYKRFPWIKDAVDRFVGDRGNFLPE